jgi:hypothetical protein
MKVLSRAVMTLGTVLTAAMLLGGVAGATVSIPENPVPVSTGAKTAPVTVSYSGLPANQPLYVLQCDIDPATAGFVYARECATTTQVGVNPQSNTTGSGTIDFTLFRGDEPSGDNPWGCYAPNDTASPGYQKLTSCWIRVTDGNPANNTDAQSVKFSFVEQGAPVPEAPTLIILPFLAGGAIGAAWLFNRRRVGKFPAG